MAIKPIKSTEISIPKTGIIGETFLFAGFKVVDKAGGPNLVVVGFTNYNDTISNVGKIVFPNQIFLKVFLNIQRKPMNLLCEGGDSREVTYFFFKDVADEWSRFDTAANELHLVCKYWNSKDEDFIYILKSIIEVETISSD